MNVSKIPAKIISIFLAGSILITSCTSTTMIRSKPNGAKIYLDGELVGITPYTHRDSKIVGSCTNVRLEKEGHKTFNNNFCRNEETDVGAIIGGIFFLFPFLWTMKYKASHTYELMPLSDNLQDNFQEKQIRPKNKHFNADRLRELKKLLDEGVLTQEEYDKEKKKVLDEKY